MLNLTQLQGEQTLLTMLFEKNKIIGQLIAENTKLESALKELENKLSESIKEDENAV